MVVRTQTLIPFGKSQTVYELFLSGFLDELEF